MQWKISPHISPDFLTEIGGSRGDKEGWSRASEDENRKGTPMNVGRVSIFNLRCNAGSYLN